MLGWLAANLINIVLIAVIALITALLIRSLIRDRRAGKSACGGNCASCGACGGGCASCGCAPSGEGSASKGPRR